jgi:hypothetical protein
MTDDSNKRIVVADQLQKRIDAVQDFLDGDRKYIPDVASAPSTFAAHRAWSVPELGIWAIGSKSSTNQRRTGTDESRELLAKLSELNVRVEALKKVPRSRKPRRSRQEKLDSQEANVKAANADRDAAISRYHEISHELDSVNTQLKARQLELQAVISEKEDLNARYDELVRQVGGRQSPALTLVTKALE